MYKFHCSNLRKISASIKLIQRDLRESISTKNSKNEFLYTRLLSQLVSTWIETRLNKLIEEPSCYVDAEKKLIRKQRTQMDKWMTALNISVCKANSLAFSNKIRVIEKNLPFIEKSKYKEIKEVIKKDLLSSTQIRNKLAHGQWEYAFLSDFSSIDPEITKNIRMENIVTIQLKMKMFETLTNIIHDLVASPSTYNRDFNSNHKKLMSQKNNFHGRDYSSYKESMINKYLRGKIKKQSI